MVGKYAQLLTAAGVAFAPVAATAVQPPSIGGEGNFRVVSIQPQGQPTAFLKIDPVEGYFFSLQLDLRTNQVSVRDDRSRDGVTVLPTDLAETHKDMQKISQALVTICSGGSFNYLDIQEGEKRPPVQVTTKDDPPWLGGRLCAPDIRKSAEQALSRIPQEIQRKGLAYTPK